MNPRDERPKTPESPLRCRVDNRESNPVFLSLPTKLERSDSVPASTSESGSI